MAFDHLVLAFVQSFANNGTNTTNNNTEPTQSPTSPWQNSDLSGEVERLKANKVSTNDIIGLLYVCLGVLAITIPLFNVR